MNRLLRALMLLVVFGSLIIAGASYALLSEIRRPVDVTAVDPVDFEIQAGQTAADVAENLKSQNLIRQPLLFRLMLRQQDATDKLNAGNYQLSPNMTMAQIIATLEVQPSFEEKEFQTIEGMRMEEVAQALVDANVIDNADDFLKIAKNAAPFKDNHTLLKDIPDDQGLEGYLFPDTYRIKATATITDVIEKMLTDGFDAKYKTFENQVIVQNRTVHDIVTMASIVQREAANADEMPHLAYILWNRIEPEHLNETGGLIGADPTVQYIAGYSDEQKTWWRNNLTQSELDVDNPYNTRKKAGLPPGPIDSPGLDALRAAARPGPLRPDGSEGKDDLYFVAKCGEKGHNYAKDLNEFNTYKSQLDNCKQ